MTDSERRRLSNADMVALLAELEIPTLSHRVVGGYSPKATRALLGRAATTIQLLRNNAEADGGTMSEEAVREAVGDVLMTAHRAAEQVVEEANAQAERIVQAARTEASTIEARAAAERLEIEREIERLRTELNRLQYLVDDMRSRWHSVNDALHQLSDLATPT